MPIQLNYFISYAHADKAEAGRFFELLKVQLSIVKNVQFTHWRDDMIELGADWHEQIQQAIQACDFGLLLVSYNFLASKYIRDNELAHFVSVSEDDQVQVKKPVVPVFLKPVRLDGTVNMRGLDQLQIFRDANGRCFSETRGHTKEAFVDQLTAKIMRKFQHP